MSEIDDARNANRQAALGSMDPSRVALARPEVRAAFEQQQQAQKQYQADMEELKKQEEARRIASKGKIEGMKRSKGRGADKVTTSGSEVVEKKLAGFATSFGSKISPIQQRLEQAQADLERARASGNPVQIQDAAAKLRAAAKEMEKEYESPEFRQAIELAKDYTYYVEGKEEQQAARDAKRGGAPRSGWFDKNMSLGERIGITIGKSYENVQTRKDREARREENLKDPSSMAFRLAYQDKFGKDPTKVTVMDRAGKEVRVTSLGMGVTPEAAGKYVSDYEKFKAERKGQIKDVVQDYVEDQAKAWIQSNPGLDLKFSNVKVYYDKQGNPTDAKGNQLISQQGVIDLSSVVKPPEIIERTRGTPGRQVQPPDPRLIRTYENFLAVAPGTAEAYAKANNLTSWLSRNPVGVANPDINNTAVGVRNSTGNLLSNIMSGSQNQQRQGNDQSMFASIASFGQQPAQPEPRPQRGTGRNSLLEMFSI